MITIHNVGEISSAATREQDDVDLWVQRCSDLRAELNAAKIRHERELHEERELRRRAEKRVEVLELVCTHTPPQW